MERRISNCILAVLAALLVCACSTTDGLKEGEVLYTGIKKIRVEDRKNTYAESVALTEVEAALAYAPNNSFMGSSSLRFPLPVGLWIYNGLADKQKSGFNKWMFNTFASTPVTLTMVNPDTRVKVATNTLQNYGYFQGSVNYSVVEQSNPKKAKVAYDIKLGEPYLLDSIRYAFPTAQDSLVKAYMHNSYLRQDGPFSVVDLQSEKDRITSLMRNNGYYYYRSDYIKYYADSMLVPQRVKLLVMQDPETPVRATHKWHIGRISAYIRGSLTDRGGSQSEFTDSTDMRGLKVVWTGYKCPISPRTVFRNFRFWQRQPFSAAKLEETLSNLGNMQVFSLLQFSCTPRDTTSLCDTLDVRLDLALDQPIEVELDFSLTQKSNSQVGPNAKATLSKRNAFGHGETLSLSLNGSYEWQTGNKGRVKGADQINSYDAGGGISVSYPWLVWPGLSTKRFRYPASTLFKFDFDHLNRSGYYRLLSFNAEATYSLQTSESFSHKFTPISITYDRLEHTTERFDSIAANNSALLVSLQDQFIPAMQYTVTYDNSWNRQKRNTTRLELSVKESGNIVSGVNMLLGNGFNDKGKRMFSAAYSQFLKLTADLRNKFRLTDKSLVATRLYAGVLWSYGNSSVAPYSELFYAGGANDIRAFAARAIGPGRYCDPEGRGTYLDQAGDFKLEANVEYRFNMVSNLYGAVFVDAGNVWLLRRSDSHPDGELGSGSFLKSVALGTGFGFRYDMEYLVLRLDLGIGLHAPYDTGRDSYFNIPKFRDSLGLHFAVGYPF